MQFKNSSSTAILFFTRSAEEEARVKHFIAGDASASLQIANCMIDHSIQIIRKTGLPYFIVNSKYQKGKNFGERYSNAFADIFEMGFQKIISIGNDCASLSHNDIMNAAEQLNTHDFVSGPDQKGGLYLVAMHRKDFNKQRFASMPWGTGNLAQVIVQFCDESGLSLFQTTIKRDIHTRGDLALILHTQTFLFRLKQLAGIFLNRCRNAILKNAIHFISALFPSTISLKSPPKFG